MSVRVPVQAQSNYTIEEIDAQLVVLSNLLYYTKRRTVKKVDLFVQADMWLDRRLEIQNGNSG